MLVALLIFPRPNSDNKRSKKSRKNKKNKPFTLADAMMESKKIDIDIKQQKHEQCECQKVRQHEENEHQETHCHKVLKCLLA